MNFTPSSAMVCVTGHTALLASLTHFSIYCLSLALREDSSISLHNTELWNLLLKNLRIQDSIPSHLSLLTVSRLPPCSVSYFPSHQIKAGMVFKRQPAFPGCHTWHFPQSSSSGLGKRLRIFLMVKRTTATKPVCFLSNGEM